MLEWIFLKLPRNILVVGLALGLSLAQAWAGAPEITILTANDLEGRLESRAVKQADGNLVHQGGFGRLAAMIKKIKKDSPDTVMAVSSGDDLMGDYFAHFGGRAIYGVMAEAGFDVGSLGNHEFDLGPDVLAGAIRECRFPIVATNLTPTKGGPLQGLIKKYVTKNLNGIKVGIFGLITPHLPLISNPGNSVRVDADIVATARKAVHELRINRGVQLVVCLSHLGLAADKELARQVAGIDVISGGHSHTLVPNGKPVTIDGPNGSYTVIVQTGSQGLNLGRLDLVLGDYGIVAAQWTVIPLTEDVPEDPVTMELIASFKVKLPPAVNLGRTTVPLDTHRQAVRAGEAVVGNLITDAMRQKTGAQLAVYNGGGIRGDRLIPTGELTSADIDEMLPFGNRIEVLQVTGRIVGLMLDWGLTGLTELEGRFLQVSGLRFMASGSKAVQVEILNSDGSYSALEPDRTYTLAVNDFMGRGGDGFSMLKPITERHRTYVTVKSMVASVIREKKIVSPRLEGRIRFDSVRN